MTLHAASRPGRSGALYIGWVLAFTALGLWLRREALWMGFVADDYAQLGMLQGHYLVPRSPFNLFSFSDGSLAESQTLLRGGFYHWWSHPQLRLSMLRPLASAMIWLDWELFGNRALAHHLHSLAWWLAYLGVVAYAFARLLPLRAAGLAFAFLVLDEAHGIALAWLANRSVFVTTVITLSALLYYLRWRRAPSLRGGLLLAVALSLALGFGEYTLCALSFFVSYELLMERGPLRRRLVYLVPVLGPAAVFLVLRSALEHEPQYSGVYVGLSDPALFAGALVSRLPVLYSDLLLSLRADHWTFGAPWVFWLFEQGWVSPEWLLGPEPWRRAHEWIGLGAMALTVGLVLLAPSTGPYRHVRWLALGGALSTIPVVSSFPSSRLLIVALIGFAPLLASFVVEAWSGLGTRFAAAPLPSAARAALAGVLGLYHLSLPAVQSRAEIAGLYQASLSVRGAVLNMRADARLPAQRVVVLSAAEDGTSMYIPLTRKQYGLPAPRACWTLSRALAPYTLVREGPRSLVIRFDGGYTMLATAPEQLLRTPRDPLRVGQTVDVGGMRATVLELRDRRPVAVRFEFDVPLEDPSLRFVYPTQAGIVRFPLPAIGQSVVVPQPIIPPAR